jgi:hypothetical protein
MLQTATVFPGRTFSETSAADCLDCARHLAPLSVLWKLRNTRPECGPSFVLRKVSDWMQPNGSKAASASENLASAGIPMTKGCLGSSAAMGPFTAVCQKFDMEKGAWKSARRALALEVMDDMVLRQASSLVSDPRNGTVNTF